MAVVPFATQSYKSRSLPVSAQRVVNCYAEQQPSDAKSTVVVFGVPGLTLFSNLGVGPIRGVWQMAGVLYAVSGGNLYSIDSTGTPTVLGGTISGNDPVSMADNGTQLCIVNGAFGYIYSTDLGFQLITDENFHAAKTVTFFDNYFVFDWMGTNQFFISGTLDGTTYNALDFASAEVSPDYVVAIINQQENLLIFGQNTIETWYDSGSINFPFNRYDGATIERGCVASLTVLKEDNSVFFLGNDLVYYRLNGVIPVRISTHAIEHAWTQYPTQSDAFSFSYTWEGHKFIVLTFPSGNATWVYDIATNLWHERESFAENGSSQLRWRGNCHTVCYGKNLVGDAFSGNIGFLDNSTFTEFGNPLRAMLIGPVVHSDRHRVFMSRFELDVETGAGVTVGQGSDPQIMLNWSDDGGRKWSDLQLWRSSGAIGAYRKRLRWLRLGQFRQRVMKVTISDPVPRVIISNNVDMRVGSN